MDTVGSEVNQKIRSAIKAKLVELGSYVDEELPDYIMVLVANKKTKSQMDDDLSLFLGHNTERFTSWLHHVMQKLNAASGMTQTEKSEVPIISVAVAQPKATVVEVAKESIVITDDETTGQGDGIGGKKNKEKKKKKEKSKDKEDKEERRKKKAERKEEKRRLKEEKKKLKIASPVEVVPKVEEVKIVANEPVAEKVEETKEEKISEDEDDVPKEPEEEDVVDMSGGADDMSFDLEEDAVPKGKSDDLRLLLAEVKAKKAAANDRLGAPLDGDRRIINLREESTFPTRGNSDDVVVNRSLKNVVSSTVKSVGSTGSTTGVKLEARVRPLMSRISGLEPQVSAKRLSPEISCSDEEAEEYDPKQPQMTVSSRVEVVSRPKRAGVQPSSSLIMRAMADAAKSTKSPVKLEPDEGVQKPTSQKVELFSRSYKKRQHESSRHDSSVKKMAITVLNQNNLVLEDEEEIEDYTDRNQGVVRKHTSSEDDEPVPPPVIPKRRRLPESILSMKLEDPQFIVTLEGVEALAASKMEKLESSALATRLGPPLSVAESLEEVEEFIEEVEEWEEEPEGPEEMMDAEETPSVTSKLEERCRFWPACKLGNACIFQHPTIPCKTFPNCIYGDRCLFIHPNCRFDATCTRPDCVYTHASPRHLPLATVAVKKKVTPSPLSRFTCRYFPKCSNVSCPYFHPLPCRFGAGCMSATCSFIHPEIPTVSKLNSATSKLRWVAPSVRGISNPPVGDIAGETLKVEAVKVEEEVKAN